MAKDKTDPKYLAFRNEVAAIFHEEMEKREHEVEEKEKAEKAKAEHDDPLSFFPF